MPENWISLFEFVDRNAWPAQPPAGGPWVWRPILPCERCGCNQPHKPRRLDDGITMICIECNRVDRALRTADRREARIRAQEAEVAARRAFVRAQGGRVPS